MQSVNDIECSEQKCGGRAVDGSPVPLCPKHLRQTFEFAQGVVSRHWVESFAVAAARIEAAVRPPPRVEPMLAAPTKDVPSWVYFVRIGDLIKIGYSTYPAARFKSLKVDEVLAVIPGSIKDEKRCHTAFQHLRVHGEYFQPGADLLAFIADVAAA